MGNITWTKDERNTLADYVATRYRNEGREFDPHGKYLNGRSILSEFIRDGMDILPPNRRRNISHWKVTPWIVPLIQARLDAVPCAAPSTVVDTTIPVVVNGRFHLETDENDKSLQELLLEAITHLSTQVKMLNENVATLTGKIDKQSLAFNSLEATVNRRRQKYAMQAMAKAEEREIIQRLTDANPTKSTRILVAGIDKGDQKEIIRKDTKGFPGLNIIFVDTNIKPPSNLGEFDHLIIMDWVPQSWKTAARNRYPKRSRIVGGLTKARESIFTLYEGVLSQ